ncbi:hypothetical protein [Dyella amyloliquefaciens]|uniref:hypothetical protein n=1 Tax=Dyella amyloliquefaciens TaxID=1770545 RepID=UPI00102ECE14|nr:hypothetical protein [Dyella amyloliquefaciens]
MPIWIKSWLACCVVFLLSLAALNWLGQFDNVTHDAAFSIILAVCYVLVFAIAYIYFRSKERNGRKREAKHSL